MNVATLEVHRIALTGHCYRMLGSASEADDAVQETMVRAWKSLDKFEERAAVSTWLYRMVHASFSATFASSAHNLKGAEQTLITEETSAFCGHSRNLVMHDRCACWLTALAKHNIMSFRYGGVQPGGVEMGFHA